MLDKSDFEMRLITDEGVAAEPIAKGQGLVVLDATIDPLLQEEGRARDFVRLVQNARKDAGLAVTDRIALTAKLDGSLADAVKHHADYVMGETLSVGLDLDIRAARPSRRGRDRRDEARLRAREGGVKYRRGCQRQARATAPCPSWPGVGPAVYAYPTGCREKKGVDARR